MPKARFVLRSPTAKAPQPIYLIFRFKNERLHYGTGLSVAPKNWDSTKQRVRQTTNEPRYHEINAYLNELATAVESAYLVLLREKVLVTKEALRMALDEFTGQVKPKGKATLFGFIERFIEQKGNGVKPRTLQRYQTTLNFLRSFAQDRRYRVDFDTVDHEMYNAFIDYLAIGHNQALNTIGVYIKNLKVFFREAYSQEVTELRTFEKRWFKVPSEESTNIYLTESELEILYSLDLSDIPRLERVRDLFLVACWTGCRYSDMDQVTPDNITNGVVQMQQSKTGSRVAIPVHPVVEELLEKYGGRLPAKISNQKMNDYLKEIGERAGLIEQVEKKITKGGETVAIYRPKYEMLTSHTARRSFATNQYKAGIPAQSIMAITGHKTESNFLKYIKLTHEDHARIVRGGWEL